MSYSWTDNTAAPGASPDSGGPREEPWVTGFREGLEKKLRMYQGRQSDQPDLVWQDVEKVRFRGTIQAQIAADLDAIALFCAIVTPAYVRSQWCADEIDHFKNRMLQQFPSQSPSDFFMKVLKQPVAGNVPKVLASNRAGAFYRLQSKGAPVTFEPGAPEFESELISVAYELHQALSEIEEQKPRKGIVYLCCPCDDTDGACTALINELRDARYQVTESVLDVQPGTAEECRAEIEVRMSNADMIIHLVGNHPPHLEPPVVDDIEQLELSIALGLCGGSPKPHLFLWQRPGMEGKSAQPAWPSRTAIAQVISARVDFRSVATSTLSFDRLKTDVIRRLSL